MGLSGTIPAFLVLRFVGGAASAFVLIIASTVVLERLARVGRSGLSALHFAGIGSGIAVSAVLVAAMLLLDPDWRSLWLASGAVSIGAVFAVAILLPNKVANADALPARGRGAALDAGLHRLIMAYGLFGFGYIITATFLVTIVRGTPVIRALEPVIWIVFGLAAAPSVSLWAWIAKRFVIPTPFTLACVIEAMGVLATVPCPPPRATFSPSTLSARTL